MTRPLEAVSSCYAGAAAAAAAPPKAGHARTHQRSPAFAYEVGFTTENARRKASVPPALQGTRGTLCRLEYPQTHICTNTKHTHTMHAHDVV